MRLWVSSVLCLLLVSVSGRAAEREPGTLTGKVIDEATLQAVAGASVQLLDTPNRTLADDNGQFTFHNIPPGVYRVQISRIGYKTTVKPNVFINPGTITTLVVEMAVQYIAVEGVEVHGSYFDKAKDAIVSTRTMDYEEIREQPGGVGDIQRVMQALPAVVSAADQENEIIVRGGAPGENLFLMDNVEIPNPNHFGRIGTTGGPINMLNTAFIREVDFMAGAFPAKYGDKASSVMEIRLREGSRQQRISSLELSMAGAGGLLEGPFAGGKGSYLVSARKSYLDLIISGIGLTAVPQYYNFQGKIVYDLSQTHKLILNGLFGDDNIHIEGETTGYGSSNDMDVRSGSVQWTVGATLRSLMGSQGYGLLTLSHSQTHWDETVYKVDTWLLDWRNDTTEKETQLKYDLTYQITPKFEVATGISLKQTHFDYTMWARPDTLTYYQYENGVVVDSFPVIDPQTGQPVIYEMDVQQNERAYKYAGYMQIKLRPTSRLTLQGGLRYDYFDYTSNSYFSPRTGFSYEITPRTAINLAYGVHYQSPAYFELTRNPANDHLKHKYTTQYVAGIEHLFADDFKGTLEVYYKTYDDFPVRLYETTPEPNDPDEGIFVNAGGGRARGIELFLQKKLSRNFYGTLSYSYSVAEADDPRYPGKTFDWHFDYRHVFTLITGYRINMDEKGWYQEMSKSIWYKITGWMLPFADQVQLGLKWRYLGGRPYTPPVYHPEFKQWQVEEVQDINTERLPAYHRLDVRMDRRYFFKSWNLVTFIEIENLYNQHNIWDYSYEDDGDRETIYQFETLPVGGVVVEF